MCIKFLKEFFTRDLFNASPYFIDFLLDVKYISNVSWISAEDNSVFDDGMEVSKVCEISEF
jgi:hypothetical protein